MTIATQNLENDHVYILQLTEIMIRMAKNDAQNTDHLKAVVDIIKNFADGLHHKKEEDLLFPLFEQRTAGGHCAPVGVMLMEHEQGREYVKGMVENIAKFEKGDKLALQYIHHNMLGYAELLQQHIYKENNVLFRMADEAFSTNDQEMLLGQFNKVETEGIKGNSIQDYIYRIKDLQKKYI